MSTKEIQKEIELISKYYAKDVEHAKMLEIAIKNLLQKANN